MDQLVAGAYSSQLCAMAGSKVLYPSSIDGLHLIFTLKVYVVFIENYNHRTHYRT